MESNDENIDSTEDSNSVSTDVKNDSTPLRDKIYKKNTNVVFVSPNELEDWDIDETKPKIKKTPRAKSIKVTPKVKPPKPTPKSSKKKRGRPKRKKLQNPWSSDIDDENVDLENEISDDEYFRRLEEASEVYRSQNENIETMQAESVEIAEEEEEEIYIGQMKTFDLNNSDLLNYIITERENSLHINDPQKPPIILPPSSNDLKCPRDCVLQLFSIYETVVQYFKILRISPFKVEDFISAMVTNENSNLLSELHMSVLGILLREDELSNTALCPIDQKDGINLAFHLMDSMTWSELLRLYVKSIDMKSQKIHISESYPFVSLYDRINVLTYLLDLFIFGSNIRNEIARESSPSHEDFCRICQTSGEVLCCDSCTAVYHLDCLTPQLSCVPTTTWNCPVCEKHKIPGLFDCNFDGEKAQIEHKKTPLGQDRFGNTFWFIARRLIVEPRNDNIENLADSILEKDDEKDFEPVYENVEYFSTYPALEKVREQLSRDWEAELCDVFDSLLEEIKKSMGVTLKLTEEGMVKYLKKTPKDLKVVNALDEELKLYRPIDPNDFDIDSTQQKHSTDNDDINGSIPIQSNNSNENVEQKKCNLKTMSGQPVGVIEDQEGLLVRNIDGSTVRVRLSAKTRSNQLEEVASMYNCEIDDASGEEGQIFYRLSDEGDWRFYVNLFSTEFGALSKHQHQEEKDRKRILGNKYSLNECNEFHWYISQPSNRAGWFNNSVSVVRPPNDILGGPLNMLQCIRLTLQNIEAQMFSSFMCPSWKTERKNWLINIQRTRSAASLAEFVAIFESAIRSCGLKKVWTNSLGYLYLDRITAAEREEEKRIKTLERKGVKPEGELVKTRNPGFLKHTIWKTKGEEYRRSGGDGWAWVNVSITFNGSKIKEVFNTSESKKKTDTVFESHLGNHNVLKLPIKSFSRFAMKNCTEELINISSNVSNDQFYQQNVITNVCGRIDELINIRTSEFENAKVDFDLEVANKKLSDLTNQRSEIRSRKAQLEEKLEILSKNYSKIIQWRSQQQNRKRIFPNYDQSFTNNGEKRMRYQNENSPFIGQYDGNDDEDMSTLSEVQPQTPLTIMTSKVESSGTGNVNLKPIVINSANSIRGLCVLNIPQSNTNSADNQNRVVLNQSQQFKVDYNSHYVNGTWPSQIVRFPNNQILRLITPPTANNQGPQQIRKLTPGGPQFLLVNNMPNMAQVSTGQQPNQISNGHIVTQPNLIYTSNSGMQVPIRLAANNNQQPLKRLLPMEPAMMQQKQFPNAQINQVTTAPSLYPNVMVGTSRMSTPVQGRRTISKVTHNIDCRMVPSTDSNDELVQRKEIDNLCIEILSLDQQLDQLDKQISELENKIQQIVMDISESYKLYNKLPVSDPNPKVDPDYDKLLPYRNPYKWPVESKHYTRSFFLYKNENLRPLVLSAGRIEVPGFDVEKKRLNNIFWPYPTARPSLSATWRYHVSRVINSDELDERIFDLAATEPGVDPNHDKLKNVGSSGLSRLALCVKILWYCLRWDDMLTNWQSSGLPTSINLSQGIYKETLISGEILERKIIGWKPSDKFCSQCSYLVTICTTTTNTDSPGSTNRSRGRSSRRGRQRASARYTDIDYFTDDGEIDSEDSDPNFIPGVSRSTKSRGRRQRNRNIDDLQVTKLPEKKFREEWMDEEMLELWEIRDYLMSINWRKYVLTQTKNQSQIVSSIMTKREFQKTDQNLMSQSIQQQQQQQQQQAIQQPIMRAIGDNNLLIYPTTTVPISNTSNPLDNNKIVIPINITTKPVLEMPGEKVTLSQRLDQEPETKVDFPLTEKPALVSLQTSATPSAATVISQTSDSVIKVFDGLKAISKPESLPSKLIIESSSVASKSSLSTSLDVPIIQKENNIVQNYVTKSIPVPITDIREISRAVPEPTGLNRSGASGGSVGRGKGRGRGRGRGRPPLHRSVSSHSEDTKHEDILLDMESALVGVIERMNSTKQNLIEIETIRALKKIDDIKFSELAKKESKKIKKQRKEYNYKDNDDSSDELTDREVETGSTSPAVDSNKFDEEENEPNLSPELVAIPRKLVNNNHTPRVSTHKRAVKRKKKHKHESISSDDMIGGNTPDTSEQRSESNDRISIVEKPVVKSRVRKVSSSDDFSSSPRPPNKSKARKVEVTEQEAAQEQELYCICKTYDPTQKYIGCDYCERWYHFSCVQMTGKKVSSIDMWKCQICQQKENEQIYCSCKTKYDQSKVYIGCDFCDEWYHPSCVGMTDYEANNYQGNYKCPACVQTKKKSKRVEESSSTGNCVDYERKVNPDIRRKLSELLNKMMKHKNAIYFLKPVDSQISPRYYQVVRSPMDLSTAKLNLDKMKYSTIGSFKLDMHKIFTACRIYFDKSSKEYQSADKLEAYFLSELREIY